MTRRAAAIFRSVVGRKDSSVRNVESRPSLGRPHGDMGEGAHRLRESIVLALQGAGITLPDEQLTVLCRNTAGEAFIIR
jgi:hypothetical protein